jgi:hypothetical protein
MKKCGKRGGNRNDRWSDIELANGIGKRRKRADGKMGENGGENGGKGNVFGKIGDGWSSSLEGPG